MIAPCHSTVISKWFQWGNKHCFFGVHMGFIWGSTEHSRTFPRECKHVMCTDQHVWVRLRSWHQGISMPMNKVMLLLDSWLHGAAQKKPITTWSPKSKCLKRKSVLVRKDLAQIQIHHDCVSMLVCFRFAILYEPYSSAFHQLSNAKQSSNVVSIIVAAPLLPRMGRWELCGGGKWLWQTLTNAGRLCWSCCSMWFFDTKKIQKASILWFILKLVLSYWSSEVIWSSWFPISRWSCLSRGHPSRESAQWCVTSTMSRAPQTDQPGSTGIRDQR